jgi:ribulose-phosphate 3-epimerase
MQSTNGPLLAPSILSADFAEIGRAVDLVSESPGSWVHMDVMDGDFVPNITFGHKMVADVRKKTSLPVDVHLMISHPETQVHNFCEAGADTLTFHIEAAVHTHRIVQEIRERDVKPGISLVPSTPVSHLREILPFVDLVLVMTVNPGFGGQSIIWECVDKVRDLTRIREEEGFSFLISVDGGVNRDTSSAVIDAGADVLVCGSAFFGAEDPIEEAGRILTGQSD